MNRVSAVVTPGEVEKFFSKWHVVKDGDELTAVNAVFTVKLTPGPTVFNVRVEAKDDPADSDEKKTDDPLKFISDFTGVGIRGASGPSAAARAIRAIAIRVKTGTAGPEAAERMIRRVSASLRLAERGLPRDVEAPDLYGREPDWNSAPKGEGPSGSPSHSRDQEQAQAKALEPLQKKLRGGGWKFREDEMDNGAPSLVVDVGGEFEATVSVDSVSWDYSFSVNHTGLVKKGKTDDPLRDFRNFRRGDEVAKAREERERPQEQQGFGDDVKLGPAEQDATVKPGARKP